MHLLAGPFAAFALLLGLAGAAKAARPLPTVRALRGVKLPGSVPLVRALGAGEFVVAVVALTVAGLVPALLVALSYASFAAFVAYAMAKGGAVSSCGCFGKPDSPPTRAHLVVNVGAAVLSLLVAARPARSPLGEIARSPGAGVPLVLLILITTALAYLLLAEWPRLVAVMRGGPSAGRSEAGA